MEQGHWNRWFVVMAGAFLLWRFVELECGFSGGFWKE
jgi:hypothetical protein